VKHNNININDIVIGLSTLFHDSHTIALLRWALYMVLNITDRPSW